MTRIPDEWRMGNVYNCLSDSEFKLLQEQYEVGDEFCVDDHDCECETYVIDSYHRCSCGNRRCYIAYDETHDFFYVEVW